MTSINVNRSGAQEDFAQCQALARSHYENFAVGSRLVPGRSRAALAAVYAVLRIADDLADEPRVEGGDDPAARAEAIRDWGRRLEAAVDGTHDGHFAIRAGAAAIRTHNLPLDFFRALFRAFVRDTEQTRYETFEDLLSYCRDSANPVGRLVLALFGDPARRAERDPRALAASDAICTGLQLVNHWQDVASDAVRGRLYLPLEDLARFGVSPESVLRRDEDPRLRALLAFEVRRARSYLESGAMLLGHTRGRLRAEVALFRRAGLQACSAVERAECGIMNEAPRLAARHRLAIVFGALSDLAAPPRTDSHLLEARSHGR